MQREGEGLTADLRARGFVLTARAPDRLYAISERYGGTHVQRTIQEVITQARALVGYIEWREAKEQER